MNNYFILIKINNYFSWTSTLRSYYPDPGSNLGNITCINFALMICHRFKRFTAIVVRGSRGSLLLLSIQCSIWSPGSRGSLPSLSELQDVHCPCCLFSSLFEALVIITQNSLEAIISNKVSISLIFLFQFLSLFFLMPLLWYCFNLTHLIWSSLMGR